MSQAKCANCKFRAAYDRNQRSILGRVWKWHTGWCPGFKSYVRSLPDDERRTMLRNYPFLRI